MATEAKTLQQQAEEVLENMRRWRKDEAARKESAQRRVARQCQAAMFAARRLGALLDDLGLNESGVRVLIKNGQIPERVIMATIPRYGLNLRHGCKWDGSGCFHLVNFTVEWDAECVETWLMYDDSMVTREVAAEIIMDYLKRRFK